MKKQKTDLAAINAELNALEWDPPLRRRVYPPPFGREEDCICSDAWRKTRPRNHSDKCVAEYERKRASVGR